MRSDCKKRPKIPRNFLIERPLRVVNHSHLMCLFHPRYQKPGTAKPGGAKKPAGAKAKPKKAAGGGGGESKPAEALLSDEAVDEKANALLGEENVKNLANSNWKERLAAMENIEQVCVYYM